MRSNNKYYCELCLKERSERINLAEHTHHLFSATTKNKELYKDLIHHPTNLARLCSVHHLNKPIPKHSEIEFCQLIGIVPRSKTGKLIWQRMKQSNSS